MGESLNDVLKAQLDGIGAEGQNLTGGPTSAMTSPQGENNNDMAMGGTQGENAVEGGAQDQNNDVDAAMAAAAATTAADAANTKIKGALMGGAQDDAAVAAAATMAVAGAEQRANNMANQMLLMQQTIQRLEAAMLAQQNSGSVGNGPVAAEMNGQVQVLGRTKHLAPKLSKFSGKREHYESWRMEAEGKLLADGVAIGDQLARLNYLFASMEPDAQNAVKGIYKRCRNGKEAAEKMLLVMDRRFLDPNAASNALEKLTHMRQGNEAFAT